MNENKIAQRGWEKSPIKSGRETREGYVQKEKSFLKSMKWLTLYTSCEVDWELTVRVGNTDVIIADLYNKQGRMEKNEALIKVGICALAPFIRGKTGNSRSIHTEQLIG